MEELMTAKDVARYLRLNKKTGQFSVHRWAKEGKLKAGKAGSFWRFRKEDVDDFTFANSNGNHHRR